MPSAIAQIKTILLSENVGHDTLGPSNWFITKGRLMDSPDRLLVLSSVGGMPPEVAIKVNYPTVQVLVRGQEGNYTDSESKAQEVARTLHAINDVSYGAGDTFTSILQLGSVIYLGDDDSRRTMHSVNFRVTMVPTEADNRAL